MVAVFVPLHSVCRAPQGRQLEHEESYGEIDMLSSILDAGNMGMALYIWVWLWLCKCDVLGRGSAGAWF